jgi:hypothetical protein
MRLPARKSVAALAAAVSLAGAAWATQDSTPGIPAGEFEKLHKEVRPPRGELWRSIPWKISLLEGREAAAKEKKPIFAWIASGEPLGCG